MQHFDVLIIGAGQAAIPLARKLSAAGKRVGLAERKLVGGSCVNFGCTPSKAAFASARVAHLARSAASLGLDIKSISVDFPAVLKRARTIVERSRTSLEKGLDHSPTQLLRGHARFTGKEGDAFQLQISDVGTVTASQVVLDTGTRTACPPIEGLADVDFIDPGNWLHRDELPAKLLIIGGGYIGIEMAQFYRRMGSEVEVVQEGKQILPHEDADVAAALQALLEREGITFHLGTELAAVKKKGDAYACDLASASKGKSTVSATHLFLAAGRTPNTDDLGLETVGVRKNDKGIVEVDERLATSVPGIWCAGDIRGGPMFTHTSWDDNRILASQMLGDGSRTTDRIIPYAVFTDPELGRVGMTQREAEKAGKRFKLADFKMNQNGKANQIGQADGFARVLIEEGSLKLLGAAVLAAEGAELVQTFITLMNTGAPATAIENAVYIHPTMGEAMQSAIMAALKQ